MKKISFILCILTIFFSACKKNIDQAPKQEVSTVKVENGYLAFTDDNAYYNFTKNQRSLSSKERRKVESKLNFTSLASLFEDVKEKIEAVESEDGKKLIVEVYRDVFKYDERGLGFKNDNDPIAISINRDGYYKIGQALYKSIDNFMIIATVTNFSELSKIHSTQDYLDFASNDMQISRFKNKEDFVQYLATKSAERTTGDPYTAGSNMYYLLSVRNESNNRRFFVDLKHYNNYNPSYIGSEYFGFYYSYLTQLLFSHQKKGTFGWNSYNSPTYIQDLTLRYRTYPFDVLTQFAGTLDNGWYIQEYTGWPLGYWEGPIHHTVSEAATWVEPIHRFWTMSVTATGNGQILYTNVYQ
jgi:hypothetical protein